MNEVGLTEVRLTVTGRDGATREVHASPGTRLMQVLRDQVDTRVGVCDGALSCGTCLVRLGAAWSQQLAAPGPDELEMLDALGGDAGCRLSCQIEVAAALDGLALTVVDSD